MKPQRPRCLWFPCSVTCRIGKCIESAWQLLGAVVREGRREECNGVCGFIWGQRGVLNSGCLGDYVTPLSGIFLKRSVLWYANSISVKLWHLCVGVHGRCLCVWRPEFNAGVFFSHCLRWGLSTNWLADGQAPGILLSLPPRLQDTGAASCVCTWVLGINLRSSWLLRKGPRDWGGSLPYAASIWVLSSLLPMTLYGHTP